MDLNDLRSLVTVVSLVLFIALVAHTWSRRRKAEHGEAANLVFAGDTTPAAGSAEQGERRE